mmetsp:Transcript_37887/g.64921  ORF Transcript_37887/g.64921 Transcript_37887/m.64921 type:complete len:203 (+) Transcript_37887:856-1464(+)
MGGSAAADDAPVNCRAPMPAKSGSDNVADLKTFPCGPVLVFRNAGQLLDVRRERSTGVRHIHARHCIKSRKVSVRAGSVQRTRRSARRRAAILRCGQNQRRGRPVALASQRTHEARLHATRSDLLTEGLQKCASWDVAHTIEAQWVRRRARCFAAVLRPEDVANSPTVRCQVLEIIPFEDVVALHVQSDAKFCLAEHPLSCE